MIEPKSCPFCGGEAVPVYSDKGSLYTSDILMLSAKGTVKCKKCGVRLPRIYSRVSKAIEAWNRRVGEAEWIPVTEWLPEGTVLVTVETKMFKHKYICEAVWIPRWSKIADFDSWEDCSEYNEDEDEYYVLEGWYERIHNWDEYSFVGIEDKVIAWKPLPEPYKGGHHE